MERISIKNRHTALLFLSALLLLLAVSATAVSTYARYKTSKNAALDFQSTASGAWIYAQDTDGKPKVSGGAFVQPQGWTSEAGGTYKLTFAVSNEKTPGEPVSFDQSVQITVFVTEGVEFASNATIKLKTGGNEYEGVPHPSEPGSAMYEKYGAGRSYSFNTDLSLAGGTSSYIPAELEISGTYEYPAAVTVFAATRPR